MRISLRVQRRKPAIETELIRQNLPASLDKAHEVREGRNNALVLAEHDQLALEHILPASVVEVEKGYEFSGGQRDARMVRGRNTPACDGRIPDPWVGVGGYDLLGGICRNVINDDDSRRRAGLCEPRADALGDVSAAVVRRDDDRYAGSRRGLGLGRAGPGGLIERSGLHSFSPAPLPAHRACYLDGSIVCADRRRNSVSLDFHGALID